MNRTIVPAKQFKSMMARMSGNIASGIAATHEVKSVADAVAVADMATSIAIFIALKVGIDGEREDNDEGSAHSETIDMLQDKLEKLQRNHNDLRVKFDGLLKQYAEST